MAERHVPEGLADELVEPLSTPETIDPHQFRSVLSGSIIGLMGEGLLTRDPQTMEIKPLLAESVKNLNPNTWEVKLRKGVKFHNGEDFNAESVKFTIERAITSKLNTLAKLTWPPAFGQEVHAVDAHTVRITTKVPDPMVPARLAVAAHVTELPGRRVVRPVVVPVLRPVRLRALRARQLPREAARLGDAAEPA